jgi:hypothetical protein
MQLPPVPEALVVYLAGITKRWAETGVYDRLNQVPEFRRLKGADVRVKYVIEAFLNYAGAVFTTNMPARTPAQKYVKMVLEDAPAELSKRLINGASHPPAGDSAGRPPTPGGSGIDAA